jgi:ketosteroid isomerase-like protein
MKSAFSLLLPVLALVLVLEGCEKTPPPPPDTVLFQAIQDNVKALEKKDVDAVMATIHPKSLAYQATREAVTQMFQVVDLKCTLTDLHVVTASADEAQVGFVQKTEKTGGEGQFQDNIVRGIHTLKLDDGKWKIFDTKRTSVTGLDGKPLGTPAAGPEQDAAPAPAPAAAPTPQSTPPTEATPKPPAPAEKPPQ